MPSTGSYSELVTQAARYRPASNFRITMKQLAQRKKAERDTLKPASSRKLPRAPTGIQGLDEITFGGLPRGRATLISGGAGAGKTLFGLEFLVRGVTQFSEPGVFMSFEETIPKT